MQSFHRFLLCAILGRVHTVTAIYVSDRYFTSREREREQDSVFETPCIPCFARKSRFGDKQGCISCGILVSGIRARRVSSEHMENMEMFSCSPTLVRSDSQRT